MHESSKACRPIVQLLATNEEANKLAKSKYASNYEIKRPRIVFLIS